MPFQYRSLQDRLFYNTVDIDGCWVWLGWRTRDGYGRLSIRCQGQHKKVLAHRLSYELFIGPIPAKHDLDHGMHCKNRSCIHPNHLTPVEYRKHRHGTAFIRANPPK